MPKLGTECSNLIDSNSIVDMGLAAHESIISALTWGIVKKVQRGLDRYIVSKLSERRFDLAHHLPTRATEYRVISNKEMHIVNGNKQSKGSNFNNKKQGQQTIVLAHLNIGGGLKHKMAEMDYILDKYNIDVLGISESNQLSEDVILTHDKNYNFKKPLKFCRK